MIKTNKPIEDQRKWQLSADGDYFELIPEQQAIYNEALNIQIELWLHGQNTHNSFSGECCCDMACCGEPAWSYAKKIRYLEANEQTQLNMCLETINAVQDKVQSLLNMPVISNQLH